MSEQDTQTKTTVLNETASLLKAMAFATEQGGIARGKHVHIMADSRWNNKTQSYQLSLTCYAPGFDQTDFRGMPIVLRKDLSVLKGFHDTITPRSLTSETLRSGDLLNAKGDFNAALAEYRDALKMDTQLASEQPDELTHQQALAADHERIGDILNLQGEFSRALTEYRAALAIDERYAHQREPHNWAFNLAGNHERVGDVLFAKGDVDGALTAYQQSAQIHEKLATNEPTNTRFRRALALSQIRISTALAAQGNLADAQTMQQCAFSTDQHIATALPDSYLQSWQDLGAGAQSMANVPMANYVLQLDDHGHAVLHGLAPGDYRFSAGVDWLTSHIGANPVQTFPSTSGGWHIVLEQKSDNRCQVCVKTSTQALEGCEVYFAFLTDTGIVLRGGVLTIFRQTSQELASKPWEGAVISAKQLISYIECANTQT